MLPHNLFEAARKANIYVKLIKIACAFLRKGLVICQHFVRYTFTVLFSAELGLRFAAGGQVFMALKQFGAHPSPCVGDLYIVHMGRFHTCLVLECFGPLLLFLACVFMLLHFYAPVGQH